MRRIFWLSVLLGSAITLGRPAFADTLVSFIQPERFTDAALRGGSGPSAREPALNGISAFLVRLADARLAPGQTLRIEVTDIDLAGQIEPWRIEFQDTRIMRDVYPPRIALRYHLLDHGREIAGGEDSLVDVNYLASPGTRLSEDPLRYEKVMLATWFRSRFVASTKNPAG